MPQAIVHILVPMIILAIIRKLSKNKFNTKYIIIGGLAGIFPDMDIPTYWIIQFFGYTYEQIHRTFLHTIFIPAIFLVLALISKPIVKTSKNKLSISIIFMLLAFGSTMHLVLDATIAGKITPFYPLSKTEIGTGFPFNILSEGMGIMLLATLDGALFVLLIIYLEMKHNISSIIWKSREKVLK